MPNLIFYIIGRTLNGGFGNKRLFAQESVGTLRDVYNYMCTFQNWNCMR